MRFISDGHWLEDAAADGYLWMLRDGCPPGITDAGRTHQEQIDLFLSRYTTNFALSSMRDKQVWQGKTYWRKRGVESAATPGTSNHETGRALDLPEPARSWMHKHGAKYGWVGNRVKGEPWHFEFVGGPTPPTPTPLFNATENDMRAVATPSGRRFVLGELTFQDMSKLWAHASHEAKIWNLDTGSEPQVIPDETLDLAIGQIQQRRAQLAKALKDLGV